MSDWKPGDVALVLNEHKVWNVAICTLRSDRHGLWWRYGVAESWSPIVADARPLVVIDPKDREQVERLLQGYAGWVGADERPGDYPHYVDLMQAALREFADPKPPKPDEPLGLAAVVEASNGVEFIHLGQGLWVYGTTDGPSQGFFYDDVDAVRVLSDGVQP